MKAISPNKIGAANSASRVQFHRFGFSFRLVADGAALTGAVAPVADHALCRLASPHMKPVIDYSKDLRRKLADGKTTDQAMCELRDAGASIFDCIASVRALHHCDLAEAKRIVQSSSVWSDHRDVTEEFLRMLSEDERQA